jgi:hypothetical protein
MVNENSNVYCTVDTLPNGREAAERAAFAAMHVSDRFRCKDSGGTAVPMAGAVAVTHLQHRRKRKGKRERERLRDILAVVGRTTRSPERRDLTGISH